MSPITRRQSQRHTPLPRPRGMVAAPKPTYSQVVTGLACDPGKGHVTVARDPGKGHMTQARVSTQVIACDREKKHVTEARDLSQDKTRSRDTTCPRDQTRSRDQTCSRDQTRFLHATHPLIGTWKTVESTRRNVINCGAVRSQTQ